MNKAFTRIVALILIPCLTAQGLLPAVAEAFQTTPGGRISPAVFERQAVVMPTWLARPARWFKEGGRLEHEQEHGRVHLRWIQFVEGGSLRIPVLTRELPIRPVQFSEANGDNGGASQEQPTSSSPSAEQVAAEKEAQKARSAALMNVFVEKWKRIEYLAQRLNNKDLKILNTRMFEYTGDERIIRNYVSGRSVAGIMADFKVSREGVLQALRHFLRATIPEFSIEQLQFRSGINPDNLRRGGTSLDRRNSAYRRQGATISVDNVFFKEGSGTKIPAGPKKDAAAKPAKKRSTHPLGLSPHWQPIIAWSQSLKVGGRRLVPDRLIGILLGGLEELPLNGVIVGGTGALVGLLAGYLGGNPAGWTLGGLTLGVVLRTVVFVRGMHWHSVMMLENGKFWPNNYPGRVHWVVLGILSLLCGTLYVALITSGIHFDWAWAHVHIAQMGRWQALIWTAVAHGVGWNGILAPLFGYPLGMSGEPTPGAHPDIVFSSKQFPLTLIQDLSGGAVLFHDNVVKKPVSLLKSLAGPLTTPLNDLILNFWLNAETHPRDKITLLVESHSLTERSQQLLRIVIDNSNSRGWGGLEINEAGYHKHGGLDYFLDTIQRHGDGAFLHGGEGLRKFARFAQKTPSALRYSEQAEGAIRTELFVLLPANQPVIGNAAATAVDESGPAREKRIHDELMRLDAAGMAVRLDQKRTLGLRAGNFLVPEGAENGNLLFQVLSESTHNRRYLMFQDRINPSHYLVYEADKDGKAILSRTGKSVPGRGDSTPVLYLPTSTQESREFFQRLSRNLFVTQKQAKTATSIDLRRGRSSGDIRHRLGVPKAATFTLIKVAESISPTLTGNSRAGFHKRAPVDEPAIAYPILIADPAIEAEEFLTEAVRTAVHDNNPQFLTISRIVEPPAYLGYASRDGQYEYWKKLSGSYDVYDSPMAVYRKITVDDPRVIAQVQMISDDYFTLEGVLWAAGPQRGQPVAFRGLINLPALAAKYHDGNVITLPPKILQAFPDNLNPEYKSGLTRVPILNTAGPVLSIQTGPPQNFTERQTMHAIMEQELRTLRELQGLPSGLQELDGFSPWFAGAMAGKGAAVALGTGSFWSGVVTIAAAYGIKWLAARWVPKISAYFRQLPHPRSLLAAA